jgi:hypothetical protein
MTPLSRHIKTSGLMVITIRYGKEKIQFNLGEEVTISELKVNSELKSQPSKYGFVLMLQGKLRTRFEDLKTQRRKIRGRLYKQAKDIKHEGTGRYMSDDLAKAYVEAHPKFIKISEDCIKAKDDLDQIYAAVKAFEQRAFLIQTISSNIRNEKG